MDPQETAARFEEYRRTGDRSIRNHLIEDHVWLATHCARRFAERSELFEDLVQVAQLGLLKAVERFDTAYGVRFATFAMPTILGELRRHFRDHTWGIHVSRRMKDLYLEVNGAIEHLGHELGRPPRVEELAEHMRVRPEDVLEAIEVGNVYKSTRLGHAGFDQHNDDEDDTGASAALGGEDPELAQADLRLSLRQLVAELPERERRVVFMRFYEGRTQSEIADDIGCSQVHVSRILRSTLDRLGAQLEEMPIAV